MMQRLFLYHSKIFEDFKEEEVRRKGKDLLYQNQTQEIAIRRDTY
jgi:hypothetical protein